MKHLASAIAGTAVGIAVLFLPLSALADDISQPSAYLVTHLAKAQQFTGRLVARSATNLAEEIVIFDCKTEKQRAFRKKDGYTWKEDPNVCDGRLIAMSDETVKEFQNTPLLHLVTTNAYAFEYADDRAVTVVIPINFKAAEIREQLSNLWGKALAHWDDATNGEGLLTLRYAPTPTSFKTTLSVFGQDGREREAAIFKEFNDPDKSVISAIQSIRNTTIQTKDN